MAATSEVFLLAATGIHAGFQLTVTLVAYPALFRASDWDSAHAAHRRAITPLVAFVYFGLIASAAWVVIDAAVDFRAVVAFAGIALSLCVTAVVAAPLHSRLSAGKDARLVQRLRAADVLRSFGACIALVACIAAVV